MASSFFLSLTKKNRLARLSFLTLILQTVLMAGWPGGGMAASPMSIYSPVSVISGNEMVAVPVVATIPASGIYCSNTLTPGVTITLQNSEVGVTYQLYKDGFFTGVELLGTGTPLAFGAGFTAGVYYVYAFDGIGSAQSPDVTVVAADPPVANFSFPANTATTCASQTIPFTDLSTPAATISAWQWNFGDVISGSNNTSVLQNPGHIFEAFGNLTSSFEVTLIVSNSFGCTDTTTQSLSILQKPDATLGEASSSPGSTVFNYCNASPGNPTGTFSFSNESSTIPFNTNYSLDFGFCSTPAGYNNSLFTNPIAVNYNCLGIQNIVFTVQGSNGCSNTRDYQAVVDYQPTAAITGSGTYYGIAPYTVKFAVDPLVHDNSPTTTYMMDFGDGNIEYYDIETLPQDSISHTYTMASENDTACNPGNPPQYALKATFTAENSCGESSSMICPIMVSKRNVADFTVAGTGGSSWNNTQGWFPGDTDSTHLVGCQSVQFTNLSDSGFYVFPGGTTAANEQQFFWDFGDPASGGDNTSTLPNPIHVFSSQATICIVKVVTWTGNSTIRNMTADTMVKYIYIQSPPIADFITDYPPVSGQICTPVTVQVTDQSIGVDTGFFAYQWRVLDALTGLQVTEGYEIVTPEHPGDTTWPEPMFQFDLPGRYRLEMILSNSCGWDTAHYQDIEVLPNLSNMPSGELTGPHTVCSGSQNVPFSIAPLSGATGYTWTLPFGSSIVNGAGTPSITVNFPNFSGNGMIRVTPTNICSTAIPSLWFPVKINSPLSGSVTLTNIVIPYGIHDCLSADSIVTGGVSGTFIIENEASVKLIAEDYILMKPGTTVHNGGYLHARLTDSCVHCESFKSTESILGNLQPSEENRHPANRIISNDFFRIYPNPTKDFVTIEFNAGSNDEIGEIQLIDIYGQVSDQQSGSFPDRIHFSLINKPAGIYVLLVNFRGLIGVTKVVKIP